MASVRIIRAAYRCGTHVRCPDLASVTATIAPLTKRTIGKELSVWIAPPTARTPWHDRDREIVALSLWSDRPWVHSELAEYPDFIHEHPASVRAGKCALLGYLERRRVGDPNTGYAVTTAHGWRDEVSVDWTPTRPVPGTIMGTLRLAPPALHTIELKVTAADGEPRGWVQLPEAGTIRSYTSQGRADHERAAAGLTAALRRAARGGKETHP